MRYFFLLLLFLGVSPLFGQTDSIPQGATDVLEDMAESAEVEEIDDNTIFDGLEAFLSRPLDLNQAQDDELALLRILSDVQIRNLIAYRQKMGAFISIYELQSIPGFDVNLIKTILPYVTIKSDFRDYHISRKELLFGGKNQIAIRWLRTLQQRKGYLYNPNTEQVPYQGDPNQVFMRYRYQYDNRLSYGVTMEKDAGEAFFAKNNKQGFDFYSAHFFADKVHPVFKTIALGDYQLNLGQGLIYYSGFAPGKSAMVTAIRRSTPILRPFASVRESFFLRGAATTVKIAEGLELTAFASYKKNDANVTDSDTTDLETDTYISSLLLSGFHRTQSEIEDKGAIQSTIAGASLRKKGALWHVSVNSLYEKLGAQLERRPQLYNQYYFSGNTLFNNSIDYSFSWKNAFVFGEHALDQQGNLASVVGVLSGLTRYMDLALFYRNFPKGYESLHAVPFAETSGAINESGFYTGLVIKPSRKWNVQFYHDLWQHPWLRYQVDAPSGGQESLVRVRYYLRHNLELYAQVRREVKERNVTIEHPISGLSHQEQFRYRIHLDKKLNRSLRLRTRAEWSHLKKAGQDLPEEGFLLYQDVLYRPWESSFSFTGRIAYFETDSYQSGIYAYENNMLYTFSIPAYYEKGIRTYLNIRYRPLRPWTFEFRIANTYFSDLDVIGSGNDQITGKNKTDIGVQVRYVIQ